MGFKSSTGGYGYLSVRRYEQSPMLAGNGGVVGPLPDFRGGLGMYDPATASPDPRAPQVGNPRQDQRWNYCAGYAWDLLVNQYGIQTDPPLYQYATEAADVWVTQAQQAEAARYQSPQAQGTPPTPATPGGFSPARQWDDYLKAKGAKDVKLYTDDSGNVLRGSYTDAKGTPVLIVPTRGAAAF